MTDNLPEIRVNEGYLPGCDIPLKLVEDESKVIRTDTGEVAVLLSPGFGGGFITWNYDNKLTPFCPPAVLAVLLGRHDLITEEALAEYYGDDGSDYWYSTGGVSDLIVVWLKPGTAFRYSEYDGSESLITVDDMTWRA